MPWLLLIGGYLLGSVPFGLVLGKVFKGVDLRTQGSGNIGATNAGRILGKKYGTAVLVLDALKGLLPTLAARLLVQPTWPLSASNLQAWPTLVGLAAVLGHVFPLYLRFRGGKGVATGLGVAIVLGPLAIAIALVAFVVLTYGTGYVAVGSMSAAVTYAIVRAVRLGPQLLDGSAWPLWVFTFGVPVLIIWAHRTNISRLRDGTEGKSWGR